MEIVSSLHPDERIPRFILGLGTIFACNDNGDKFATASCQGPTIRLWDSNFNSLESFSLLNDVNKERNMITNLRFDDIDRKHLMLTATDSSGVIKRFDVTNSNH